jgi:hypothetical protein
MNMTQPLGLQISREVSSKTRREITVPVRSKLKSLSTTPRVPCLARGDDDDDNSRRHWPNTNQSMYALAHQTISNLYRNLD